MFDINKYLLTKMGWVEYSRNRGIKLPFYKKHNFFEDDDFVRFFIVDNSKNKCYIIKEQNEKNLYKFIVCSFYNGNVEMQVINVDSNIKLLGLIKEYNACDKKYQRTFSINKILK